MCNLPAGGVGMVGTWVAWMLGCVGEDRVGDGGAGKAGEAVVTGEAAETLPVDPEPAPEGTSPPSEVAGASMDIWKDDGTDKYIFRPIVHQVRLTFDDDALDTLNGAAREDAPGTLSIDDDPVEYPMAAHLKGTHSYRTLDMKPAFKVDFHAYNPYERFHGLKRIVLHNMVQDPTFLHEYAYFWFAARMGIPAQRHAYAWVQLNGEDLGLYSLLEDLDEQFVERIWPDDDDGMLYEGAGNDFLAQHADFELEEGVDGGELAALVAALEPATGDDFMPVFEAYFDVERVLDYLALDIVTGNPDGYEALRNNFFAYYAPNAGKWTLLPSGVDRSFVDPNGIPSGHEDPRQGVILTRCMDDDACHDRLYARVEELLDAWEALDLPGVVTAKEAVVGPLCQADPRRDRDCRSGEMLPYMVGRYELLRGELE